MQPLAVCYLLQRIIGFFFSSRRRHTRYWRDWSSDVCSSDLDVDHGTYPYVTSSNPVAAGACVGAGVGPTRIDRVVGIAKAYTTRVGEGPMPTELLDADGEKLRQDGAEFGTTTGRPRRCGWFDAVVVEAAARANGFTDIFLTKLDVLTGWEKIPVCVGYEVDGVRHKVMPMTQVDFAAAAPVYEELDGWPRSE